jgi:hypothetical protein
MKRLFPLILLVTLALPLAAQDQMQPVLENVYNNWRRAMVTKNARLWSEHTSRRRQVEVRNRLFSERSNFPQALFNLPVAPPDLRNLTPVRLKRRGPTAKMVYFGKVDFGVGGEPTENLFVVSFVQEDGWKYDNADFINLAALPDVRVSIAKGDYSVLEKPEFTPTGAMPDMPPVVLQGKVPFIAKAYAFCPGRQVTIQVNRRSRHQFANTQASEVVVGGAQPGENTVEFKVTSLPGGTGNEPLTVRVYLMSEKPGVKIPAVFEYTVPEGGDVKSKGQGTFTLSQDLAQKLR